MSNVARKRIQAEASHETATVALVSGADIVVHTARGERRARRAASCLVAPAVGDEVALVVTGDARVFVVAVLVRAEEGPVELAVEGDLSISARDGAVRIDAERGVEVRTGGVMSLLSKTLKMSASEGTFALSRLTVLASSVLAHSDGVRLAARAVETFCEHVAQSAKVWQRTVDELDVLRAGRVDHRAEKELCIRAENYLVAARNLAKVDAEQIHIG